MKINLVADAEQYGLVIGHVYIPPCHELKWSAAVTRKALALGGVIGHGGELVCVHGVITTDCGALIVFAQQMGKRPGGLFALLRAFPCGAFLRCFGGSFRFLCGAFGGLFRIGQHRQDKRFAVAWVGSTAGYIAAPPPVCHMRAWDALGKTVPKRFRQAIAR